MTTDPFTTAARAEADRRMRADGLVTQAAMVRARGFAEGAEWARDHLAEQEPSDAEVEAAARKVFETDAPSHEPHEWFEASESLRSDYRATARLALSAARAVGRDAR